MLASDVLNTDRDNWLLWAGSSLLVVFLHVGGAFFDWNEDEDVFDDEVAGAIVMELAPITTTQRVKTPDAALGPQSEESVATPPTTEKVEETRQLDIPQFEQSPLAPDPEVALPVAKPVEEIPDEEKPEELEEVQPENLAMQQAASSMAMSPQQIEADQAPVVKAKALGEGKKNSKAILTYRRQLLVHQKKFRRYPSAARRRGQQGTVKLEFSIDRSGKVVGKRLLESSGYPVLDKAALAAVDRASPYPPPPVEETGEVLRYAIPIQFKIKR